MVKLFMSSSARKVQRKNHTPGECSCKWGTLRGGRLISKGPMSQRKERQSTEEGSQQPGKQRKAASSHTGHM